jgi:hypothetical protein
MMKNVRKKTNDLLVSRLNDVMKIPLALTTLFSLESFFRIFFPTMFGIFLRFSCEAWMGKVRGRRHWLWLRGRRWEGMRNDRGLGRVWKLLESWKLWRRFESSPKACCFIWWSLKQNSICSGRKCFRHQRAPLSSILLQEKRRISKKKIDSCLSIVVRL